MKYIVNILALTFLVALVFGIITFKKTDNFQSFKDKIEQPIDYIRRGSEALKHNVLFDFSDRKDKSISMAKEESALMSLAPKLFRNFSRPDWDNFWAVIYKPVKEKKGDFGLKRYRTKDEMRERFIELYGNTFLSFGSDDWGYFWDIVLGENG